MPVSVDVGSVIFALFPRVLPTPFADFDAWINVACLHIFLILMFSSASRERLQEIAKVSEILHHLNGEVTNRDAAL